MKNRFLFGGLLLWSFFASGQQISKRKIERLISAIPAFQQAHVGVNVVALDKQKTVAAHREEHYMTPASNTKLLTFLGALQTFDSLPALEYWQENDSIIHFRSTAYPLLLHPFYSDVALFSFFKQKRLWSYHTHNQHPKPLGEGWAWDDYNYYYAAESSAFPIYGNSVQAVMRPEGPELTPKFFVLKDTLSAPLSRRRNINAFSFHPSKWQINDTLYRPFITSDSLFTRLLKEATHQQVVINESHGEEVLWKKLYTNHDDLLYKGLLQDSDNGLAEALLLMIAKEKTGILTPNTAIKALQEEWSAWLPDPIEWADGSGVSRYNMVTPRTLVAVLKQIYSSLNREQLQAYFPKSGSSGTLKAYAELKNVYAKTGTLRHNHNLSGYWISAQGNPYAFSIMVNHYTAPTVEIRRGITALITALQKKLK